MRKAVSEPNSEPILSPVAYDSIVARKFLNLCLSDVAKHYLTPDWTAMLVLLFSRRRQKSKTSITKKEEKLLRQLKQITLLMQESRLEGASPEMEAEEVPYDTDWEGT